MTNEKHVLVKSNRNEDRYLLEFVSDEGKVELEEFPTARAVARYKRVNYINNRYRLQFVPKGSLEPVLIEEINFSGKGFS